MSKITREHAIDLIKSSNGMIFAISFAKNDGSIRNMVCRTGVSRYVKSVGMAYEPSEHDLVTVYDVQRLGYRMIRLNTMRQIKIGGREYSIVQ
jgi:hypothetical protein